MTRSVSTKMGIRKDSRAYLLGAPTDALKSIDLPDLTISSSLRGEFDYIHFFARNQAGLHKNFSRLKNHLKPTGSLWISWPKAKQLSTDLTLTIVIKIGYDYGLVESKSLSVNETWSALKFTHPRKGKIYANSYGKLNAVT